MSLPAFYGKKRKQKAGKAGFPEYTAVVGDFVLVMEDKADRANLCLKEADGTISMTVQATTDYAVNGALHYAQHILQKITYKKFLRSAMPVIASTILYSRYLLIRTVISGCQKSRHLRIFQQHILWNITSRLYLRKRCRKILNLLTF